jgi:hypothetical protein
MSEQIRLSTGQKATLTDGRVEVISPGTSRYRLTVRHADSGGTLHATARDYGDLIEFLRQTERLHYELRSLSLEE